MSGERFLQHEGAEVKPVPSLQLQSGPIQPFQVPFAPSPASACISMPTELMGKAGVAPEGPRCYLGISSQALQRQARWLAFAASWAGTQQVSCVLQRQVEAPEETGQWHVPAV